MRKEVRKGVQFEVESAIRTSQTPRQNLHDSINSLHYYYGAKEKSTIVYFSSQFLSALNVNVQLYLLSSFLGLALFTHTSVMNSDQYLKFKVTTYFVVETLLYEGLHLIWIFAFIVGLLELEMEDLSPIVHRQ